MKLDTLVKDLRIIINSATIKYTRLGKDNETVDSARASDAYIAAMNGTDNFITYSEFSIEALEKSGLTPPMYDILEMITDKSLIPEEFRNKVVEEQRKIVIRDYVELNNYYRMLHGLPDIEEVENDYIRLTPEQELMYNVVHNTPIHEISEDIIYSLDSDGVIETLIQANPTKKYLKHLGYNSVDYLNARDANNFSLLHVNSANIPDEFFSTFMHIYEQNREYFSSVIYIYDYSSKYDYYDNFIGLCIMVMTIQRMVSNSFRYGIQRNFFDWAFIQNMYKTYNIPFIEDLPMEYHIIILKNLNNLLRYKSTDKVLFDICSLLGYERINIFKYYMIKKHKLDANEEPLFYYTEVINSDGTTSIIEDKERMYELYFQAVNIKERNITLALLDTNNRKDYNEVTLSDPYWWEDEDLQKLKYDEEYNYIETKYMGLNLMYKMTKMLFEITYSFRLLMDNHDDIDNFEVLLPRIYEDKHFKLFNVIIFIVALICKRSGFTSYTITNPSMISHVYGFNFDPDDISAMRSLILDNPEIDQSLLTYLNDINLVNAEDINKLFSKIHDFNDAIINKMRTSTNVKEYRIYKKIFTIMMVSEIQTDAFTIEDSEGNEIVAGSYLEYLEYSDPILAQTIDNATPDLINVYIDHAISKINDVITELQYLYILTDNNSPIFKSISELMRFFKSYTVDLDSFNVLYLFDSKIYNLIKFIDDIKQVQTNLDITEDFNIEYSDIVHANSISIDKLKDYVRSNENVNRYVSIKWADELLCDDILRNILENIKSIEDGHMTDIAKDIYKDANLCTIILNNDKTIIGKINQMKDTKEYIDEITELSKIIDPIIDNDTLLDDETYLSIYANIGPLDDIVTTDSSQTIEVSFDMPDSISVAENIDSNKDIHIEDEAIGSYSDNVNMNNLDYINESVKFRENLSFLYEN